MAAQAVINVAYDLFGMYQIQRATLAELENQISGMLDEGEFYDEEHIGVAAVTDFLHELVAYYDVLIRGEV